MCRARTAGTGALSSVAPHSAHWGMAARQQPRPAPRGALLRAQSPARITRAGTVRSSAMTDRRLQLYQRRSAAELHSLAQSGHLAAGGTEDDIKQNIAAMV